MKPKFMAPLAVLLIIQFLVMVGFGIIIPIIPFFVDELGGGALTVGIFMSVYSIMQFFFAPIWGRLSDRIGRRPIILMGLSGYAVTFILFGLVDNLYLLIGLRALSGMISSATLPTSMAYLADVTEGRDRSKGMGMIGAAMGLGMIFGPALGGWLGVYSFSLPFFVAGGLALLLVPFTVIFLPESLRPDEPMANLTKQSQILLNWQITKHPLFSLFSFNFVMNFTFAMLEATLALLALAKFGFHSGDMGMVFAILGVSSVVVQGGLIGWLVSRYGDARLVTTGGLICSLGMLFIILTADQGYEVLMVISTVLFMVGNSLMNPTSTSLVTKQSSQGQGASLGIFTSFGSLGRILGPVIGGALYGWSMDLPYVFGAILLLLIVLLAGGRIGEIKEVPAEG